MRWKVMIAIVLSVFVGSGMLAIVSSESKPNGAPFQAIWNAIDYLENIWSTDGNDVWSGLPGNVGIGTDTPSKKLHVVGDAQFSNTANDTYFFIETGQGGTDPIPADGKRIGAWDEESGAWKPLGVDGAPLVLNGRSLSQLRIGGRSIHINLDPSSEPDSPDEGFILYVDIIDGGLKAKSSDGNITMLASK